MSERPRLEKGLDGETFRSFYYLKEELTDFCRENGLPVSGGKMELTDRIAHFLDTGEIAKVQTGSRAQGGKEQTGSRRKVDVQEITEETLIEDHFVCSEKHRAFFQSRIGKGFSFNVAFQKWLKSNTGKTYAQAIEAYDRILEEKKRTKTTIEPQFEYNTYIRDFFADNPGTSLEQAIWCWKYKKSQQGHNRYEKSDLSVLTEATEVGK